MLSRSLPALFNYSPLRFVSKTIFSKVSSYQRKEFDDNLILVNQEDKQIGEISKLKAHLLSEGNQYPHRAFSVFLFNNKNELLLQQRSKEKVTFPLMWSNTCCSHPLNNPKENDPLKNRGIKTAVTRRMKFELGIDSKIKDYFLTDRILYRAKSNEMFEEFELDYLFMMKSNLFRVNTLNKIINKNEIGGIKYLSKKKLIEDMKRKDKLQLYTPWFRLIIEKRGDELFDFFPKHRYNSIGSIDERKIINFL